MKKSKPLNPKYHHSNLQDSHTKVKKIMQKEHEEWKTFFQGISQAILVLDPEHGVLAANRAALNVLNKTEEEVLGRKCYELFHGTKEPAEGCPMEKLLSHGSTDTIEMEMETLNGTFLVSCTPILDDSGNVFRIIHLAIDITEHKRAEEALLESEVRYREMFSHMRSGVAVYQTVDNGEDFVFKDFNTAAERISRISRDEVIGKSLLTLFPNMDRFGLFGALQRVYRTGQPEYLPAAYYKDPYREGWRDNFIYKLPSGDVVAIYEDVTERLSAEQAGKQANEALEKSERLYRELARSLPGIVTEFDERGTLTFVNRNGLELFGYTQEDLDNGLNILQVVIPEEHEKAKGNIKKVLKGEKLYGTEYTALRKDGSTFPVSIYTSPIIYENKPVGLRAVAIDITERKRAEETLLNEKEKFLTLLDNAPFGMVMISQNGTITYTNQKFEEIFGYEPKDIPDGRTWFRKAYPDAAYRHEIISAWKDDLEKGRVGEKRPRVFTATCKDGSTKIINFIPVMLATGNNLMACEDITERKKAEEALTENEARLRTILEILPVGVFIFSMNGQILTANAMMNQIWGITNGVVPHSHDMQEFVEYKGWWPDTGIALRPEDWAASRVLLRGETAPVDIVNIQRFDGSTGTIIVSAVPFHDTGGDVTGVVAVIQDITERKLVEEELRQSEDKYRTIFETASTANVIFDEDTTISLINKEFERVYGYSKEELEGKRSWTELVVKEDLERMIAYNKARNVNPDAAPRSYEFRAIDKEGNVKNIFVTIAMIPATKKRVASFLDITDRKRAEEEIQRIKTAVDATSDAIGMSTADGHHFYQNEAFDRLFGYTQEEVSRLHPAKLYGNEDISKKVFEIIMAGKSWHGEIEMVAKNGRRFPVLLRADAVKDENGKVISLIGVHTDITEHKQAEEALKESRERLKVIAEGSAIPQFAVNKDHTVILWNKALETYTGVKTKDVVGTTNHWKAFYPEKRPCLIDLVLEGTKEDEFTRWYGNLYSRSGLINGAYEATGYFPKIKEGVWLYFTAAAIEDSSGNVIAGVETLEDITNLKATEVSLRQSEAKYRSIFENTLEGIFQTTPQGQFLSANPAMARMAGYNSPEELISSITNIGEQLYVNPNDRATFFTLMKEKGRIEGFEVQQHRKDGGIFWVSINARAVKDEMGNILYSEGTFEDITLRKQAEEKLTTTLESLRRAIGVTVQVVLATVEARDPYTAGHQRRVTDLARAIATGLGLSADRIEGIRMAGSIHDIGKISIPAEILSKPTKLTDIEFSLMKAHAQYGYEILKDVESPWSLAEIVLEHHERINGSGYPRGLQGNEILMEAKILAVADVVESMASHRPYRVSLGLDVALKEIEDNAGILYDREAVEVCLKLFREKGFRFE